MGGSIVFGSYGDDPAPSEAEIARAAAALQFESHGAGRAALGLRGLLEVWQETAVNGGSFAATFGISGIQSATEWCLRNSRAERLDFTRRLLTSTAMIDALPDHRTDPAMLLEATFTAMHPVQLEGDIALQLVHGGAHRPFPGTTEQARAIAAEAVDALIGNRFDDVGIAASYDGWAPWFGWSAWDRTWIITDARSRSVTVVALTDTD